MLHFDQLSSCMCIGFPESRIMELKESLEEAGFDSWKTVIETRGVTLHANS